MNISKIIGMVTRTQGKGAITLEKDALRALAQRAGKKGESLFDLVATKNPAVDIAYKTSERCYTVGKFTLRDGEQVLGDGAISVTGLGTEQSVIKYRLNLGENGRFVQSSGWIDNTKQITADEMLFAARKKNGVTTISEKLGNIASCNTQINEKEIVNAIDKKVGDGIVAEAYQKSTKDVNDILGKLQTTLKDLVAGKEVKTPTLEELKNKFNIKPKQAIDQLKFEKIKPVEILTPEEINNKLKKMGIEPLNHVEKTVLGESIDKLKTGIIRDIKSEFEKLKQAIKRFDRRHEKASSEFAKSMTELRKSEIDKEIKSRIAAAAKVKNDAQAEKLLAEVRTLALNAKDTGIDINLHEIRAMVLNARGNNEYVRKMFFDDPVFMSRI